jgi:hypothetical protein
VEKITVALDMGGCPNRCKHCWLGHFPNGKMIENDLYYVANEFKKITNNLEITSWYREQDFLDNYKQIYGIENELSDTRSVSHFELLSHWRAVRDDKYVPWLKNLGVKVCQLTLWGGREKTDYYAGRIGTYDEIIKTIEILLDNQIVPRIQVFVNKDNIDELKTIEKLVLSLDLIDRCKSVGTEFALYAFQGSCDGENKKNYNIWVTPEDIVKIPETIVQSTLKHFNKNYIIEVFGNTEQELYQKLILDKNKICFKNPCFLYRQRF